MAAKTTKTAVKKESTEARQKAASVDSGEKQNVKASASEPSVVNKTPVQENTTAKRVISRDDTVTVRSGCPNRLVYASPRSGYVTVWENYGDEQVLLVDDLLDAKRINPSYFQKNYFLIDDACVLSYIGAEKFYDNSVDQHSFDEIFQNDADAIASIVGKMSPGQKEVLIVRTRNMIRSGELSDLKIIRTLSTVLGVEFPVD